MALTMVSRIARSNWPMAIRTAPPSEWTKPWRLLYADEKLKRRRTGQINTPRALTDIASILTIIKSRWYAHGFRFQAAGPYQGFRRRRCPRDQGTDRFAGQRRSRNSPSMCS